MAPQRKYICQFCAKAFSRSEHKARHERSHTKEKPFRCQQCDSSFVRRDLLQRHCRTVHGTIISFNTRKNSQASIVALKQEQEHGEAISRQDISQHGVVLLPDSEEEPEFTQPEYDASSVSSLSSLMNPNVSPRGSVHRSTSDQAVKSEEKLSPEAAIVPKIDRKVSDVQRSKSIDMKAVSDAPLSSSRKAKQHQIYPAGNNTALTSEKSVITILSLSKRLHSSLLNTKFHVNLSQQEISQYFISWSIVSNERLPIVKLKELLPVINSYSFQSTSNVLPANMSEEELRNNALVLAIISFGAADSHQFHKSLIFFKKSWYYLVNFMKNPRDAMPVLAILSYISLNYNFKSVLHKYGQPPLSGTISTSEFIEKEKYGKVDFEHSHRYQFGSRIDTRYTNFNADDAEDMTVIPTEVVLDYLNHISYLVLQPRNGPPPTKSDEQFDYWWVYLILSNYSLLYIKPAPKIHEAFLERDLPQAIGKSAVRGPNVKLRDYLTLLTTSTFQIDNFTMLEKIIIMCLSNELKYLTEKEHVLNQAVMADYQPQGQRNFFRTLSFFHNAIILANRSFNHLMCSPSGIPAGAKAVSNAVQRQMDSGNGFYNQLIDEFNNLTILNQKKLLINCPVKLHELITSYNFIPINEYQWYLLLITLKEFNLNMANTSCESAVSESARRLHRQFNNTYNYRKLYYALSKTKFDDVCAEVSNQQIYSYHDLISSDLYLNENESRELTREFAQFLNLSSSKSSNHSNSLHNTGPRDTVFNKNLIVNNNLGLVSIPMLFLSFNFNFTLNRYKILLNLPKFSNGDNNSKDYFNLFLVEWILTLFRVFLNLKNLNLEENYIIQSLVYMIQETGFSIDVPLNVTNRNSFNDRYNSLSSCNLNLDQFKDDKVIYYYLKNLEMSFDIWYRLNNNISSEFSDLEEFSASTGRRRGQLSSNEVFLRNFKQLLRTTVYDNLDLSLSNYISPIHPLSPSSMSHQLAGLHGQGSFRQPDQEPFRQTDASTLESILNTNYMPSPSSAINTSFSHFPSGPASQLPILPATFPSPMATVATLFQGDSLATPTSGMLNKVMLPPINREPEEKPAETETPKQETRPENYPPLMGLSLSGYKELMVMRNNMVN